MPSLPSLTLQWSALGPRRRSCTYQKPISERYASFPGMGKEGRSDIIFIHVKIPFLFLNLVVQSLSHVQLCNPMDCSTPGFPVLHYLLEFAQIHIHWVDDAIWPSLPLLPTSPKYWSFSVSLSPFSEFSGLISFKIGWFDLLAVQGILKSLFQHHNWKASVFIFYFACIKLCNWKIAK